MERLKSYLLLALLLTSVGFGVYAHNLKNELSICKSPSPPLPDFESATMLPATVHIVDTYTDASGKQHAIVAHTETSEIVRKKAMQITEPFLRIIDSQARALKIKPKEVEGYLAVQLKMARDSVRFLTRTLAGNVQTRTFQDKYLSLTVRESLPADSSDTADHATFDFAYDADLKFVEYSKQKRFFGIPISKKKFYTDISSSDPRLRIKGAQRFTIQRSEPAFGLRLQALTTYNFETKSWGAGIGTRFDVGDRFNAGLNYLYSFGLQNWVPVAYAKYDLWQIGR